MPELPEVEVWVRALRPRLEGRRIESVSIRRRELIAEPGARTFVRRLEGRCIATLRRRGKTIWFELDDGTHWLTHLRMTGWWRHHAAPHPPADRHVLAVFTLDRGQLHYRDPRRFGRMWWVRDAAPLLALLDPSVVAGVGNIYASEACFRSRLDPRTPACRLGLEEARRLHRALREVLRRAIRLGSTVAPVVDGYPARARFRDEFAVYGRAGDACRACGTAITRVVLGQRSTFFCPLCQALLEPR
ncbi:MAG: DNA-formamidopyrimidine glycosylase family protein [Planctomycetota bacterium]